MASYSMKDASKTGDKGTDIVIDWLSKCRETLLIENVENVAYYQKQDIDLIWTYTSSEGMNKRSIEIKTDTYFHTGNYFFETISNMTRNTVGCFLYSEADYMFYYFLNNELHIMNLPEVRKWFIENQHRFEKKTTATRIGGVVAYYSLGHIVPRAVLIAEIPQYLKIVTIEDLK